MQFEYNIAVKLNLKINSKSNAGRRPFKSETSVIKAQDDEQCEVAN